MSTKLRTGFPFDEAMRTEHLERIVRPEPNVLDEYDPTDDTDHGPHVDRVGMISVDADSEIENDDDPPPTPLE